MNANRYQVVTRLAQGGMGEILLARRLGAAGFEKLVVLKRPLRVSSPELVAALIDEARLLARINHPNVCQVYDLEEADGQFFFAMEYLDGLSLWAVVSDAEATGHTIDPRIVCAIFEQVCEGLDAIHGLRERDGESVGVVHRDISPGNLFVTTNGTIKILDLGIAKTTDSEELTPHGRVKGKMSYLSPEQVAGKPIDCRVDLFALGLVLYDVARGRRPARDRIGAFAGDALELAQLPPQIAAIVRTAVASDPEARFGSASEMGAALRDAGVALGGSRTRTELAAWLTTQFQPALAKRKAYLDDQLDSGHDTDAATQVLDLHSVIGRESELTRLPAGETEHLSLPDRERFTSLGGAELVARAQPAKHGRARAVVGAAIVIASVLVAVTTVVSHDSAPTVATTTPRPAAMITTPAAETRSAPQTPPVSSPPVEPSTPAPAITTGTPLSVPPARKPTPIRAPARHRTEHPVAVGQLTIDSQPFAVIRLGTRALGPTPIWQVALSPGRYQLHATTADGRTKDVTAEVEPGHETKIFLDWKTP